MPSQYPSETQLSSGQGGEMVSVAHSPHVHGKANNHRDNDVGTHRPSGKGSETKAARQNGGLPHLVLVRAHHPTKPTYTVNAAAPPLVQPLPAPYYPSDTNTALPDRAAITQTQAQPTSSTTNPTTACDNSREFTTVCPQTALSYTSAIITRRSEHFQTRQKVLDDRLQQLHSRVRGRQGKGVCRHVQSQLKSASHLNQRGPKVGEQDVEADRESEITPSINRAASIPMQVDGAVEDIDTSRATVVRSLQFESCDHSDQSENSIHVDELGVLSSVEKLPPDEKLDLSNSFDRSNGFGNRLSDGRSEIVERWRQQLRGMCVGVEGVGIGGGGGDGGEVTDASSEDEEEMEGDGSNMVEMGQKRLQDVCRKWEHSRGPIGAQWVWLRHRITKINRQLSQLDATVQQRPKREQFFLSPPTSRTLSHPSNIWGGGGGGKTVNGSNHVTSFPHLFLPDGILTNGPIQVKDLLCPSPLTNMSFVLDDVSGYTCARTRALHKKPIRKIVRLAQKKRGGPSSAPRPVLPRDTPSWVWLDEGLRHVLRDHPYASLPQAKRYSRSVSRTRTLTLSPSPHDATSDIDVDNSPSKSINQKRLFHDVCPQSPSLSRSCTPNPIPSFTTSTPSSIPYPLTSSSASLHRRKKPPNHTPSYDIDNIVIPYSVAAATRLEKLEYKEIMTPRWRELEATPTDHTQSSNPAHNIEEDTSDEGFRTRHDRYEANEKKRFMNFISGGQRKRTRPSSLSSTPDPQLNISCPPFKVRRATFPNSPSDPPTQITVPILSWPPRSFPLQGSDIDALTNPPPPPPLPILPPTNTRTSSSSPSPLLSRPLTPSLPPTPSTASMMVTPLGTPLSSPSTPFGENPISSSEWAVNPQIMPTTIKPSSVTAQGGIVLRLTKKA